MECQSLKNFSYCVLVFMIIPIFDEDNTARKGQVFPNPNFIVHQLQLMQGTRSELRCVIKCTHCSLPLSSSQKSMVNRLPLSYYRVCNPSQSRFPSLHLPNPCSGFMMQFTKRNIKKTEETGVPPVSLEGTFSGGTRVPFSSPELPGLMMGRCGNYIFLSLTILITEETLG